MKFLAGYPLNCLRDSREIDLERGHFVGRRPDLNLTVRLTDLRMLDGIRRELVSARPKSVNHLLLQRGLGFHRHGFAGGGSGS